MSAGSVAVGSRFLKALPLASGLVLVAAVWSAGAVWSFAEQRDFATARGFDLPELLPLTIDGLALSLAVVAWSAALDGRAAVQARLGTFGAIAASATSNATWAASRTGGDVIAVVLAAGVPLAAAWAFETLLAELRKGVHRRRGLPAPVAVAGPRPIRLVLAPWPTFRDWRQHVLQLTDPAASTPALAARVPGNATTERGSRTSKVSVSGDSSASAGPDPTTAPRTDARPARPKGQRPPAVEAGELLLVAQAVKAELEKSGEPVTRRNLLAGLRARNVACGTDKANELLSRLNAA